LSPILLCSSSAFWPFKRPKRRRLMTANIKKNRPGLTRVWPGGPGLGSTRRIDWVSLGQLPSGFLPPPGPVPGPGWPGPRSTCWADPGFKTLLNTTIKFLYEVSMFYVWIRDKPRLSYLRLLNCFCLVPKVAHSGLKLVFLS
jgi:hypothetical protein